MLKVGKASDVGLKRKGKENEDSIGLVLPDQNNPRPPLLIVADGMGGYKGGTIASAMVVKTLIMEYNESIMPINYLEFLRSSIIQAHQAIRMKAQQDAVYAKMGSTVVSAIIDGKTIYIANVGDSRGYLVNREKVTQISWDHSFVADQLRSGIITSSEARVHPQRNILTMSIHAQRQDVEIYDTQCTSNPGDVLVLCSDGLWGCVSEDQIQAVVTELTPQYAADKLVHLANTNQGPDNISVIVAKQAS